MFDYWQNVWMVDFWTKYFSGVMPPAVANGDAAGNIFRTAALGGLKPSRSRERWFDLSPILAKKQKRRPLPDALII
jgi:hypothetical protein